MAYVYDGKSDPRLGISLGYRELRGKIQATPKQTIAPMYKRRQRATEETSKGNTMHYDANLVSFFFWPQLR